MDIRQLLEFLIFRPGVYSALRKILWGPVIHKHWFVYKIFATYFKPLYTDPPMQWSIPNKDTDLVIESPGACAQTAFHVYVLEWNPNLNVAGMTHSPAPVSYASHKDIPCVVLTRGTWAEAESLHKRFPFISIPSALQRITNFYSLMGKRANMNYVEVFDYSFIIHEPSSALSILNAKFGLSLNVGDNVLPRIRNTG